MGERSLVVDRGAGDLPVSSYVMKEIGTHSMLVIKTYDIGSTIDNLVRLCKKLMIKCVVVRNTVMGQINPISKTISALRRGYLVILDKYIVGNSLLDESWLRSEIKALFDHLYEVDGRSFPGRLVIVTTLDDPRFDGYPSIIETTVYIPEEYYLRPNVVKFFKGMKKDEIRAFLERYDVQNVVERLSPYLIRQLNFYKVKNNASNLVRIRSVPRDKFSNYVHNVTTKTALHVIDKMYRKGVNVLLVGASGSGKTYFSKCLANRYKRNYVEVSMSRVMSKWVGETEHNFDKALVTLDTLFNCVIVFDEVDKIFSSSTYMRSIVAQFLRWLERKHNNNIVVMSINNPRLLPPELLRSGRWQVRVVLSPLESVEEQVMAWISIANNMGATLPWIPNYIEGLTYSDVAETIKLLLQGIDFNMALDSVMTFKRKSGVDELNEAFM